MIRPDSVRALYGPEYSAVYEDLYLRPWPGKHGTNVRILESLLPPSRQPRMRWLDLCCGQAWHFSRFPNIGEAIGIDLSPSQISVAQSRTPAARFICGDVLAVDLAPESADLVTCFWGAYCYLDDLGLIETFLQRAIGWTAAGGSLYLELLLPEALASFNRSNFASATAFRVEPRTADYSQWLYEDEGGRHLMASPAEHWFANRVAPYFEKIDVLSDGGFMKHLVASTRRS